MGPLLKEVLSFSLALILVNTNAEITNIDFEIENDNPDVSMSDCSGADAKKISWPVDIVEVKNDEEHKVYFNQGYEIQQAELIYNDETKALDEYKKTVARVYYANNIDNGVLLIFKKGTISEGKRQELRFPDTGNLLFFRSYSHEDPFEFKEGGVQKTWWMSYRYEIIQRDFITTKGNIKGQPWIIMLNDGDDDWRTVHGNVKEKAAKVLSQNFLLHGQLSIVSKSALSNEIRKAHNLPRQQNKDTLFFKFKSEVSIINIQRQEEYKNRHNTYQGRRIYTLHHTSSVSNTALSKAKEKSRIFIESQINGNYVRSALKSVLLVVGTYTVSNQYMKTVCSQVQRTTQFQLFFEFDKKMRKTYEFDESVGVVNEKVVTCDCQSVSSTTVSTTQPEQDAQPVYVTFEEKSESEWVRIN